MGLYPPEKPQMDGGVVESDGKKWVVAGIPLRSQLKPIFTKLAPEKQPDQNDDDGEFPTTPKAEGARIPTRMACPAAPRKRKSSPMCHYGSVREFFNPPDLETVFIRRVERA